MATKRETLKSKAGTSYTRRDEQGQFKEHDEKGRSLAQDRRRKAKTTAKKGQGDKGDQRPARGTKKENGKKRAASKKRS
jgi:hypothetical protein